MIPPLHVHASVGLPPDNRCPHCKGKTVLVVASQYWYVDGVSRAERFDRKFYEVLQIKLTGQYCMTCARLVSISVNQLGLED